MPLIVQYKSLCLPIMNISMLAKALLATTSAMVAYSTSCSQITPKSDIPSYIQTKQFNANTPIQDRISVFEMQRIKGVVVSVFDGHGGDLCADYVAGNIPRVMNARIKANLRSTAAIEERLTKALEECYDELETGFKAIFQKNIQKVEYQRVGSCALTAILTPQFIIVGNAGDCQGVILGGDHPIKLNERLNAGQPSQQQRLKKQFPGEPDVYKCIKNTNYCYVKGRLQPTRSFGDFYLKHQDYNFTSLGTFTGPYITHKPKITRFELNKYTGKTLVLATDGLWDQLDEKEMDQALQMHHGTDKTAEVLFDHAAKRILQRNKISTMERLLEVPNRRNLHDDISIVTVDLQAFLENYQFGLIRGLF